MGFINTTGMNKKNNPEYMKAILHNTAYANSQEYKNNLYIYKTASKIRQTLINEEGKENRQKMRRKHKDIIMLGDEQLVKEYSYLLTE